jgi:hypothetical protein
LAAEALLGLRDRNATPHAEGTFFDGLEMRVPSVCGRRHVSEIIAFDTDGHAGSKTGARSGNLSVEQGATIVATAAPLTGRFAQGIDLIL